MKKFILTFVAVCAAGLFCALAGGAQWGTPSAGFTAFVTIVLATATAAMVTTEL